jgi:hypothetical protein
MRQHDTLSSAPSSCLSTSPSFVPGMTAEQGLSDTIAESTEGMTVDRNMLTIVSGCQTLCDGGISTFSIPWQECLAM